MTTPFDFAALEALLRKDDCGQPQVVVDLGRVETNIDRVGHDLRGRALRIAVKSLACPRLIGHVMTRARTQRLMVFDVAMLAQCLDAFPSADLMLGKPMPLAAFDWFRRRRSASIRDDLRRIRWLLDSLPRIGEFADAATLHDLRLRVCLEIDVGLHRGGFDFAQRERTLDALARHSERLELTGLLGYDAHVARAPWPWTPARAMQRASARYRAWAQRVRECFPVLPPDYVQDGAGSPTFALLDGQSPVDEVALGSVLVKPSDFDLPALQAYEPAAWIATPVLKVLDGVVVPFLEPLAPMLGQGRKSLFIYGGRWMAQPAWPPAMRTSRLFGLSSNQQFMCVPRAAPTAVGDYVFFRPTQSEAVLDQFGVLTVRTGSGLERWPAFARGSGD